MKRDVLYVEIRLTSGELISKYVRLPKHWRLYGDSIYKVKKNIDNFYETGIIDICELYICVEPELIEWFIITIKKVIEDD